MRGVPLALFSAQLHLYASLRCDQTQSTSVILQICLTQSAGYCRPVIWVDRELLKESVQFRSTVGLLFSITEAAGSWKMLSLNYSVQKGQNITGFRNVGILDPLKIMHLLEARHHTFLHYRMGTGLTQGGI